MYVNCCVPFYTRKIAFQKYFCLDIIYIVVVVVGWKKKGGEVLANELVEVVAMIDLVVEGKESAQA